MANKKKAKHMRRRTAHPAAAKVGAPQQSYSAPTAEALPQRPVARTLQGKKPDIATEYRHVKADLVRLVAVAGTIFVAFGVMAFILK